MEKIGTFEEKQAESMRARLRVLQSLDKRIAREIRNWYEWEKMSPAYILKVAKNFEK